MGATNFEIYLSGYPESARPLPLAELTQEEKELAQKFGVAEEQFQRSKLALAEKADRIRARAVELGNLVVTILEPLGSGYRLESLARNIDTLSWTLRIQTPVGPVNVPLSWELVDDVLDYRTKTEFNRLRNMVWFGINRPELIFEST